jgi:hypothetical protein
MSKLSATVAHLDCRHSPGPGLIRWIRMPLWSVLVVSAGHVSAVAPSLFTAPHNRYCDKQHCQRPENDQDDWGVAREYGDEHQDDWRDDPKGSRRSARRVLAVLLPVDLPEALSLGGHGHDARLPSKSIITLPASVLPLAAPGEGSPRRSDLAFGRTFDPPLTVRISNQTRAWFSGTTSPGAAPSPGNGAPGPGPAQATGRAAAGTLPWGAMWGAIVGRHRATQSLLKHPISALTRHPATVADASR